MSTVSNKKLENKKKLDEYLKLRFENRKGSLETLVGDKKNFYRGRVLNLLTTLGFQGFQRFQGFDGSDEKFSAALEEAGIQIITIRTAFDKGSTLLKPVATFPDGRLEYAEDMANKQKPKPFESAEEALEDSELGWTITDTGKRFSGIYKISEGRKERKERKESTIAARIEQAVENAREKSDSLDSAAFKGKLTCFFSVATSCVEIESKQWMQIDKIVAIYWKVVPGQPQILKNGLDDPHALCSALFDEIEQIQMIDNQLFQLEGHELVSSLQPTFLDPDVAPADKVAFAITKLKNLLKKHLDSHYPASESRKINPDVHFISVSYEAIPNKGSNQYKYKPLFEIYPHVFRKEYPLSAYYISNPNKISVTKLLLKKYFDWHKENSNGKSEKDAYEFVLGPSALSGSSAKLAKIDEKFLEYLFTKFNRKYDEYEKSDSNNGFKIDFNQSYGDQIFVSKANDASELAKKLYSELNIAIKGEEEENNSTLAYVIEGRILEKWSTGNTGDSTRTKYRQLPRAVLVIEGQREELFSKAERESLRVVAIAFSSLVRHCFHDNSLLDYRRPLSTAYERFFSNTSDKKKARLSRFLLSSMAVDVMLLTKIKDELKNRHTKLPNNLDSVLEEVFKDTESDDASTSDSNVNDKLRERFERALRFAEKTANTGYGSRYEIVPKLVDFIEACPRNFAWAGYVPSLAQALGDRAEQTPPKFKLMSPGFSASGLYMAVVRSQIRQVAKLASLRKLDQEHRNYRSFVRYKLVIAARMANNAIAFDSRGSKGQEQGSDENDTFSPGRDYKEHCYGVLVSDLASARKLDANANNANNNRVRTLQDLAWDAVINTGPADRNVSLPDIKEAIKKLFGNNLGHWFLSDGDEAPNLRDGAWHGLARAFRLNYDKRLDHHSDGEPARSGTTDFSIREHFKGLLEEDNDFRIFKSVIRDNTEEKTKNEIKQKVRDAVLDAKRLFDLIKHKDLGSLPSSENLVAWYGSIVHGDLNARNLVWAGPINHLVMIDFEHTTDGLMGVDQARLAVNLVVDHMASYSADLRNGDEAILPAQIEAVAKAADYLVQCVAFGRLPEVAPEVSVQEGSAALTKIVQTVLFSAEEFYDKTAAGEDRDTDHDSVKGILVHALAMALVKEYEYGVKGIMQARLDPDHVERFLEARIESKESLEEWLKELFKMGETPPRRCSPRLAEQRKSVARYAITFWILDKILEESDISLGDANSG